MKCIIGFLILSLSLPYIYPMENTLPTTIKHPDYVAQKNPTQSKSVWKKFSTYLYAITAAVIIADILLIGSRYRKDAQLHDELVKRISSISDIAILQKVKQNVDKWPESAKKKELQEIISQRMPQLEAREQAWKERLKERASHISSLESLESASQQTEQRIPESREKEITQEVIAERRAEIKRQTSRKPGRG